MRRFIPYGLIILGVCIVGGIGFFWLAWEGFLPAKQPEFYVGMELPDLTLTTPWNDGTVEVPPPAVLPDAARKTRQYRKWVRVGNVSKLTYTDNDSRTYEAQLLGFARSEEGRHELIPKVSLYRPDGTLEVDTNYIDESPSEWNVYGTDGKTVRAHVVAKTHPAPSIRSMTVFPPDGPPRRYDVNPDGTVRYEWECDEEGNSIRALNRATPKEEEEVTGS